MIPITLYVEENDKIKDLPQHVLQSIFMLGLALYDHKVHDVVDDIINSNLQSELTFKFEQQLAALKNENLELARELADKSSLEDMRYNMEIEKKQMKIDQLERLLTETETKLKCIYDDLYKDGVDKLKQTIKEKDMQIQLMRNTNAAKGIIGENLIMDALRKLYDKGTIEYNGRTAHACDVQLTLHHPLEKTYLFESKYKGYVCKSDVTKFETDIVSSKACVQGGMFISILNKNIPEKGSFSMEVLKHSDGEHKPILYVAYDDESEFHMLFPFHCRMFIGLCDIYVKHHSSDVADDMMNNVREQALFLCDMLRKNKKRTDEFKTRFIKFYKEVEDDNIVIGQRLETLMDLVSASKSSCLPANASCATCKRTFKSAKGLKLHKCNIAPPMKYCDDNT